jgi:hypothetical protein
VRLEAYQRLGAWRIVGMKNTGCASTLVIGKNHAVRKADPAGQRRRRDTCGRQPARVERQHRGVIGARLWP